MASSEISVSCHVFVGSSMESLDLAYAIQTNLKFDAELTVWDQGIFKLSEHSLLSLEDNLNKFDFAIFILSPDDISTIRETKYSSARDNIIFELGMFIGRLGSERCYIVSPYDVDDFHLPTDLLGITPATYKSQAKHQTDEAKLGSAANAIRKRIKALGCFDTSLPNNYQKIYVNFIDQINVLYCENFSNWSVTQWDWEIYPNSDSVALINRGLLLKGTGSIFPTVRSKRQLCPSGTDWSLAINFQYLSIGSCGTYIKFMVGTSEIARIHQDAGGQFIKIYGREVWRVAANTEPTVFRVHSVNDQAIVVIGTQIISNYTKFQSPTYIEFGNTEQCNGDWNDLLLQNIEFQHFALIPVIPPTNEKILAAREFSAIGVELQKIGLEQQAKGDSNLSQRYLLQAEVAHRRSICLDAHNAEWHNLLGGALLNQDRLQEAESEYKIAVKIQPNDPTYNDNLKICRARMPK